MKPGPCANRVPEKLKTSRVRLAVRTRCVHHRNLSSILRPCATFNLVGPSLR